jgi:hypothetical protein
VAVEFESSGAGDSGNVTSLSWSHTIGGTNRHTIVAIGLTAGPSINSVTVGAVSCSQITFANQSAETVTLYETDSEPATGANTVTVTFSSMNASAGNSFNFEGVDLTTPTGDFDSNTGSAVTSSSITPIGVGGGMIIDNLRGNDPQTAATGQTSRWTAVYAGNDQAVSTKVASNNNVTMNWTFSSGIIAHIGVTVNPTTPRKVNASLNKK